VFQFFGFFFEKVPFIFGVEEESKNRIMSKRKKNAQKKELQKKKKKNKRKKKDIGTFFRRSKKRTRFPFVSSSSPHLLFTRRTRRRRRTTTTEEGLALSFAFVSVFFCLSLSLSAFSLESTMTTTTCPKTTPNFGRWRRDGIDAMTTKKMQRGGEKGPPRAVGVEGERRRRWRRGETRAASSSSSSSSSSSEHEKKKKKEETNDPYVTREELERIAKRKGLRLTTTRVGPFFKITARKIDAMGRFEGEEGVREGDDMSVIATHDGFIAPFPFNILHLDTMRVYNSRINSQCTEEERKMLKSTFGVSILLGCESLRLGRDAGCTKAELLSIDDGNEYAPKLVKYYERIGFKIIRKVGDGLNTDLPDMLVWGGKGTRMNGDVNELLEKWSNVLRKATDKNT